VAFKASFINLSSISIFVRMAGLLQFVTVQGVYFIACIHITINYTRPAPPWVENTTKRFNPTCSRERCYHLQPAICSIVHAGATLVDCEFLHGFYLDNPLVESVRSGLPGARS
jgi:hypothetical protein